MAELDVLYLTHNGITDHIGQSQIAPYCLRLAELGYRIHIVSLEKPGRDALKQRYRKAFDERQIGWSYLTYHNKPPLVSTFFDFVRMKRLALSVARRERPRLVHCRSYLPIPMAVAIKKSVASKLLIDFRHFWVEAGLADSRFKFVYRIFKRWEPTYFDAADHVVTLTRRAAEILNRWYPHPRGLRRFTVIPCCADFEHYDTSKVSEAETSSLRQRLGVKEDDTILLYLGSLGPDYLLPEMMRLFKELLSLRPAAKFLFVSNDGHERVLDERQRQDLPEDAVIFVNASRDEVPGYLKLADLSVFFYRADLSRAGCSPTKLAELFAANVPVIGNTNVGDIDRILSPDRNGSVVVNDFAPETLRQALLQVLDVHPATRSGIRAASGEYRLEEGVARYAYIYADLIPAMPLAPRPHLETSAAEGGRKAASC